MRRFLTASVAILILVGSRNSWAQIESLPAVPGVDPEVYVRSLSPILEKVDPSKDAGWDTEVFSVEAKAQLDLLAEGIARGAANSPVFTENVTTSEWRPAKRQTVLEGMLKVERGIPSTGKSLSSALQSVRAAPGEMHVQFKPFHVESAKDTVLVTAYYHAETGLEPGGKLEQSATWKISFTKESPPRIRNVLVSDYEEIVPRNSQLLFIDETAKLLGGNDSYHQQLSLGIDHWRSRLQGDFGVDVNGLQGIAIGDANGDGREDLYVCQQGGLPNRLYLRQKDGGLADRSSYSRTDWMELTRAALFIDLDNDGDQDMALAQGWYLMLLENDGQAQFTKRVEQRAEGQLHSLAAADFDNDGDLDIYFCGRNPSREQSSAEGILGMPLPYHDANNGGPNILLRNQGQWAFQDATADTGLDVNNRRYSYACSWEDYDNDGDQDLYVANDFGRNNFYQNNGGKFTDIAGNLGVEDLSAGMSITWGDPNRDGRMDPYISNMFSSAGNRIAYQRQFRSGDTNQLASFKRHARGNTLFLNHGDGFEDASVAAKVTMGRWAWGAKFADLNNDGWEDLYVANGFITTEDTGDL
ncbi:MAG: VCBS repeat-containing protein [Verrucomicrobiales bacterium]